MAYRLTGWDRDKKLMAYYYYLLPTYCERGDFDFTTSFIRVWRTLAKYLFVALLQFNTMKHLYLCRDMKNQCFWLPTSTP